MRCPKPKPPNVADPRDAVADAAAPPPPLNPRRLAKTPPSPWGRRGGRTFALPLPLVRLVRVADDELPRLPAS